VKFNFHFGKKKKSIARMAIVGIIITSCVTFLSDCTGIKEETIYDYADEIQRNINPNNDLNDHIINTPALLERRIIRGVDRALYYYERSVPSYKEIPKPRFSQKPSDGTPAQEILGGEMRICAPWVEDCPEENKQEIQN
jgi:hypothetical protein